MLTWRLGKVTEREQAHLDDLRTWMARPGATLRDALVRAHAEFRRHVTDDPWSSTDPAAPPCTPVAFCRWATRLQRFGKPTAADIGPAALRRAGGVPGLFADTMRYLAASRPSVVGVAMTLGWRQAHARAVEWCADVQES